MGEEAVVGKSDKFLSIKLSVFHSGYTHMHFPGIHFIQ